MFSSLQDFLPVWETEAAFTRQILDALTDRALEQEIAPGHRTARRLAWHIAQTIPEMMGRTGLMVEGPAEDAPMPDTAWEIAEAYGEAAASLGRQLRAHWSDDTLGEVDDMYGQPWTRGQTLGALLIHQAHHRGQLTVLLRQAGVAVPGTHGPSKEEWSRWGMEPPAV